MKILVIADSSYDEGRLNAIHNLRGVHEVTEIMLRNVIDVTIYIKYETFVLLCDSASAMKHTLENIKQQNPEAQIICHWPVLVGKTGISTTSQVHEISRIVNATAQKIKN